MSVPNTGGLLDGTTDVVVCEAQLVGELLDDVRRSLDIIVDDGVASGRRHSLFGGNGYEVELVSVLVGDGGIDHSTWHWVLEPSGVTSKESGVNSLACVDVHQLGRVNKAKAREGLPDLVDLSTADSLNLSLTNSISVEDDPGWEGSVGSFESLTSACHSSTE